MVRSFSELQKVDPGFKADDVITMSLPLPLFGFGTPSSRTDFYMQLKDKVAGLPGVQSVGGVVPMPLGGGDQYFLFSYGQLGVTEEEWARNKADYRWVTPGYFDTMGIQLLEGRFLEDADNRSESPDVVIIDREVASRMWPDESAVGRQLLVEMYNFEEDFSMLRKSMEVVGVVDHVRSQSLTENGREAIYFPHRTFPYVPQGFVVKTAGSQPNLMASIRQEVASLNGNVPVADVRMMGEIVAEARASMRFVLSLIGVFAIMALVLASIGLYGVISYSVRQRTREIGVRIAFGAVRGDIIKLIVGHGAMLSAAGVGIGLAGSFFLTRLVSTTLYGVTARDPLTFSTVPIVLLLVAVVASYVPAVRALRNDPAKSLSDE